MRRCVVYATWSGLSSLPVLVLALSRYPSHAGLVHTNIERITPFPRAIRVVCAACAAVLVGTICAPVRARQDHIRCYMKQMLEGLEFMHVNHYIHRDIKGVRGVVLMSLCLCLQRCFCRILPQVPSN